MSQGKKDDSKQNDDYRKSWIEEMLLELARGKRQLISQYLQMALMHHNIKVSRFNQPKLIVYTKIQNLPKTREKFIPYYNAIKIYFDRAIMG